jgi:hypothetical protein
VLTLHLLHNAERTPTEVKDMADVLKAKQLSSSTGVLFPVLLIKTQLPLLN